MNIGLAIKTFRKHHNITQKGLAKELKMSERMIQKYESNEVEPSLKVIDKIAVALNVTSKALLNIANTNGEEGGNLRFNIDSAYRLYKESPNDEKISSIINKLNTTGILSEEDEYMLNCCSLNSAMKISDQIKDENPYQQKGLLELLYRKYPNDKRISTIGENFFITGDLSVEDVKFINSYKEAETYDAFNIKTLFYKKDDKTFINDEGEKTIVAARNNGDISENDALLGIAKYINYIANSESYVLGSEYSDLINSSEDLIRGKILILKSKRGKEK